MDSCNFSGYYQHVTCRELRGILDKEWQRFIRMSYSDVYNYIRYHYDCTSYSAKTLAKEFSRGY